MTETTQETTVVEETKVTQELVEKKEYGGFWRRVGANLIDTVLIAFPLGMLVAFIFTGNAMDASMSDEAPKTHEIVSQFLFTLYAILLPVYWYGMTVGKKVLHLKIERLDGGKVTIGTMVMRNVVAGLVYVLTFGLGLIASAIMIAVREDKRSLHDLIAKTVVLKTKN